MKSILITGGAGFIGSALVRFLLRETEYSVVNIDKLSYAGNLKNLGEYQKHPRHIFIHSDIADVSVLKKIFQQYQPIGVIHLAAESHVDRSIRQPADFFHSNVLCTYLLLEQTLNYYQRVAKNLKNAFRFVYVSTDEVFGALKHNQPPFDEHSPIRPNNPYAASKAAAEQFVRAWHKTYGLPTIIANASNNYGEYQHKEKLIPTVIHNALLGKNIPMYGDGKQVRDWIYVEDTVCALWQIFQHGTAGERFVIGAENEIENHTLIEKICGLLDKHRPIANNAHLSGSLKMYNELIQSTTDRINHDRRYAINPMKLKQTLNWQAKMPFEKGLEKTVLHYINLHNHQHIAIESPL